MQTRRPLRLRLFAVASVSLFGLTCAASLANYGCARDSTAYPAFKSYVEATAEPFEKYVQSDESLTVEQKQRRLQAVDSARRYVREAGE